MGELLEDTLEARWGERAGVDASAQRGGGGSHGVGAPRPGSVAWS